MPPPTHVVMTGVTGCIVPLHLDAIRDPGDRPDLLFQARWHDVMTPYAERRA